MFRATAVAVALLLAGCGVTEASKSAVERTTVPVHAIDRQVSPAELFGEWADTLQGCGSDPIGTDGINFEPVDMPGLSGTYQMEDVAGVWVLEGDQVRMAEGFEGMEAGRFPKHPEAGPDPLAGTDTFNKTILVLDRSVLTWASEAGVVDSLLRCPAASPEDGLVSATPRPAPP